MKHTPTPYYAEEIYETRGELDWVAIHPCHFYYHGKIDERTKADAEFIVKACNNHEALIQALTNLLNDPNGNNCVNSAEKLLEQIAKGE